jgi:hypothetical protein
LQCMMPAVYAVMYLHNDNAYRKFAPHPPPPPPVGAVGIFLAY